MGSDSVSTPSLSATADVGSTSSTQPGNVNCPLPLSKCPQRETIVPQTETHPPHHCFYATYKQMGQRRSRNKSYDLGDIKVSEMLERSIFQWTPQSSQLSSDPRLSPYLATMQ